MLEGGISEGRRDSWRKWLEPPKPSDPGRLPAASQTVAPADSELRSASTTETSRRQLAGNVAAVPHSVTGAVLTWRSPRTLERSLASYQRHGLDCMLQQRLVLVQEGGDQEAAIARSFGWEVITEERNIGIGPAYARLVERTGTELFLFLECDWLLTASPQRQIAASADLLTLGTVHAVRLRSTKRPGFPLGMLRFQNREELHPEWLIESVFYDREPWRSFPGVIDRLVYGGIEFAVTGVAHASWSNNPHLVTTSFVQRLLGDRGGETGNLETTVAAQWVNLEARVAHAPGLFTHSRVDGPAINKRDLRYHVDQRVRWWTRHLRRRIGH